MSVASKVDAVPRIVALSGGNLVGRTRLQKVVALLELRGAGYGFEFGYHFYGPYSEELAIAAADAVALRFVEEIEKPTSWGSTYSIYSVDKDAVLNGAEADRGDAARSSLLKEMRDVDPVELELAVTAAFLAVEGVENPWEETERRKSLKSRNGRMDNAKRLYKKLMTIAAPKPLPAIA